MTHCARGSSGLEAEQSTWNCSTNRRHIPINISRRQPGWQNDDCMASHAIVAHRRATWSRAYVRHSRATTLTIWVCDKSETPHDGAKTSIYDYVVFSFVWLRRIFACTTTSNLRLINCDFYSDRFWAFTIISVIVLIGVLIVVLIAALIAAGMFFFALFFFALLTWL